MFVYLCMYVLMYMCLCMSDWNPLGSLVNIGNYPDSICDGAAVFEVTMFLYVDFLAPRSLVLSVLLTPKTVCLPTRLESSVYLEFYP